jgi:nucleotide-binding universal stress UspA family protein
MYRTILVAVENSVADDAILHHIEELARLLGSRLLLVHVADGWAARYHEQLELADSEEMRDDRRYLDALCRAFTERGIEARAMLLCGEPSAEIIRVARDEHVDLIAMSTHGHRLLADVVHGSTATKVRHQADVPVLLLKAHVDKSAGDRPRFASELPA